MQSRYGLTTRRDVDQQHREQRADDAGRAGEDVQQERAPAAVAGVQQDGEVADLLRHLVRRHREAVLTPSGSDVSTAAPIIAPSTKLWNASPMSTSDAAVAVHLALVGVAVAPEHQLLEHEEEQDAGEQRLEDPRRRQQAERLGQQREQRDAEQRADGVAHQPRHQARADRVGEEQQRRRRRAGRPGSRGDSGPGPRRVETRGEFSSSERGARKAERRPERGGRNRTPACRAAVPT